MGPSNSRGTAFFVQSSPDCPLFGAPATYDSIAVSPDGLHIAAAEGMLTHGMRQKR